MNIYETITEVDDGYHYCLYLLDGKEKQVIKDSVFSDSPLGSSVGHINSFKNYLQRLQPKSCKDTMFLMDCYHLNMIFGCTNQLDSFNPYRYKFPKSLVTDSILEESNGVLLWNYQLEDFGLLFITSACEVRQFMKDIKAKKGAAFDLADSFELQPGITIKDIILERMVLNNTIKQNTAGASIVWKYIKANNEI